MKRFKLTSIAALTVAALATTASAKDRLTAASWVGPTHIMTVNDYTNFKTSVESATDGNVVLDLHIGGSLLPAPAVLDGVRDGVADVANMIAAYIPADLPKNNLVNDVAFTVQDPMAAAFAITEMNLKNASLQQEWTDRGVVFGGGFSTPLYYFACVDPVRQLSDLAGRKIRTAGGSHVDWVKHVEAVPVSVPFTEVYTGLERGSIDCVMLDATNLGSGFKIWEVAKSVTMLPMGSHISGAEWIYNPRTWSGLSEEVRMVLFDEMAAASVRRQMDYAKQVSESLEGSWERGLERIEPDATLTNEIAGFKTAFIEGLPASAAEKRGIDQAEAAELVKEYQAYYSRWVSLLDGVDRSDEAGLIELVKTETYKDLDLASYGM